MKRILVFLLFAGLISVNNSFANSNSQKVKDLVTVFIQEVLPSNEYKNLVLGNTKSIEINLQKLESSLSPNVKAKLAQVKNLKLSKNQIKSLLKQNDALLGNISNLRWTPIPNEMACAVSTIIVEIPTSFSLLGWIGVWMHCEDDEE